MMLFLKDNSNVLLYNNKGVFKGGGGFMGFKPPPSPKFSDFFLKSEGKEIKRKRKKEKKYSDL